MELRELTQRALALSVAERMELVRVLWEGLGRDLPDETHDENAREALRRNAEIESGVVEEVPYDVVMTSLRRSLGALNWMSQDDPRRSRPS